MGANVGSFNDELSETVGLEFDAVPELGFGLPDSILLEAFVHFEKGFFSMDGLQFPFARSP